MNAADPWGRTSSASASSAAVARRLQSRYDMLMGFDDTEAGRDEAMDSRGGVEPYNCPFCGDDFDFVGFCCHIDEEHAVEAKTGLNIYGIVAFLNEQYMQRGRRMRKISSGSHSSLSLFRKDWRDGGLQSFLGGSSYVSNPPPAAPDPFLSSLVCNFPVAEPSKDLHFDSSDNNFLLNKSPDEKTVERAEPSISEKDQKERAQRSKFVRGLVLSTIFDDDNF